MRKIIAFLLVILCFAVAFSAERTDKKTTSPIAKTAIHDQAQIDANQIRAWLTNEGSFFRNPFTGNSGFEYPIGSNVYAIYASGLWIGGLVDDGTGDKSVRVAIAEYSYEYNPGTMNADGSWNDPSDSRFKMYKIDKSDYVAATDEDPATVPGSDWLNWPVADGAPTQNWVDSQGNTETIPLLMGDQTLWTIYNDADPNVHVNMGSDPLGVEVGQLTWAYNKPGALGNTVFTKFTVINKSGHDIDSCYFSVWSDPDLGDSGDDFVGCDTTLNLGICYNANSIDGEYGANPPAVGYDFFQGPVIPSTGDTATFNFGKKADYTNLPMSSFIYYINDNVNNGNVYTPQDVYNYMRAMWRDGTPITYGGDGTTGSERAYFMFPSDPENPTGNVWLDVNPGDRRFMQNTGPFTLAAGDTQEVVIGVIAARGSSNLNSVTVVKTQDQFAQNAFDINFKLPEGPPAPVVNTSMIDREVLLTWDKKAESYDEVYLAIPETDAEGNPLQRDYQFQGYIIYQYPSVALENGKVLAVYDVPGDNILAIKDYTLDSQTGEYVQKTVIKGTDSGIKRYIRITEDQLTSLSSKTLINGRNYYFGVQAYGYTPDGPDGEKVIYSPVTKITAVPESPAIGSRYYTQFNDTLEVTKNGVSDGDVIVTVVDPSKVTGLDYTVIFEPDTVADDGSYMWDLVRSDGVTVLNDITYQGSDASDDKFSVVDGLLVKVNGPSTGVSHVYEVAYHDTTLAALDNVWHSLNSNSTYFMSAGGGDGDFDRLNRYGQYASPRDFELRWTDGPNYGVSAFSTDNIMSVPFELWDIGSATPDDVSDDVRMIPFIYENVARDTFGYNGDVDPYFGGAYTASDWIYWMDPEGTDGYTNFAAACEGAGGPGNTYPYDSDGSTYGYWADMSGGFIYPIGRLIVCDFDLASSGGIVPSGTTVRLITNKPNSDAVTYTFTAPEAATTNVADEKVDLEKINVYPNPYYGAHAGEINQFQRWIRFTHLPPTCTIRVFNLAGELVRKIERVNAELPIEPWDLLNAYGLPVASGIYIYHVDAPGIGEKIGKMAILTPQQRLNTY